MPWTEVVTAVSTALTAIVIAATVVVGYRQLDHLRRATQLDGTLRLFEEFNRSELRESVHFVIAELPARMQEPKFRSEISAIGFADERVHVELHILREFEKIGTYVRHKMIDADMVADYLGPWIRDCWESLNEFDIVREHRRNFGSDGLWENFEYLYHLVCAYDRSRPQTYVLERSVWRSRSREIVKQQSPGQPIERRRSP